MLSHLQIVDSNRGVTGKPALMCVLHRLKEREREGLQDQEYVGDLLGHA